MRLLYVVLIIFLNVDFCTYASGGVINGHPCGKIADPEIHQHEESDKQVCYNQEVLEKLCISAESSADKREFELLLSKRNIPLNRAHGWFWLPLCRISGHPNPAIACELAKLLIQAGACKDGRGKTTPLNYAVEAVGNHGELSLVQFFIEQGAQVDIVDIFADSLWHYVDHFKKRKACLQFLCDKLTCDINALNCLRRTPLHCVLKDCEGDDLEQGVRFFIENGADPRINAYEHSDSLKIIPWASPVVRGIWKETWRQKCQNMLTVSLVLKKSKVPREMCRLILRNYIGVRFDKIFWMPRLRREVIARVYDEKLSFKNV